MRNAQREAVADRDVIDLPAVARKIRARCRFEIGVVMAAAEDFVGYSRESTVEARRLETLFRRKIAVARREREPVLGANRFRWNDANRHVELLHHATHDLELLAIFFAEHRDIRPHEAEELQHYGAYAVEESRPRCAFKLFGQGRRSHAINLRCRVHLLFLRRETNVDAFALQTLAIGFERARITVEVLVRSEL